MRIFVDHSQYMIMQLTDYQDPMGLLKNRLQAALVEIENLQAPVEVDGRKEIVLRQIYELLTNLNYTTGKIKEDLRKV